MFTPEFAPVHGRQGDTFPRSQTQDIACIQRFGDTVTYLRNRGGLVNLAIWVAFKYFNSKGRTTSVDNIFSLDDMPVRRGTLLLALSPISVAFHNGEQEKETATEGAYQALKQLQHLQKMEQIQRLLTVVHSSTQV